jgi:hypothetical protein
LHELEELRLIIGHFPMFFIRVSSPSMSKSPTWELTESQQHERQLDTPTRQRNANADEPFRTPPDWAPPSPPESDIAHFSLRSQLVKLGYLTCPDDSGHSSDCGEEPIPPRWNLGRKSLTGGKHHHIRGDCNSWTLVDSELVENMNEFSSVLLFSRQVFLSYLIQATSALNQVSILGSP